MSRGIKTVLAVSLVCLAIVAIMSCGRSESGLNKPVKTSETGSEAVSDIASDVSDKSHITPEPSPESSAETKDIQVSTPELTVTPAPKPYSVVLDPGHGGYDQGASYNGYNEAALTLKIAEYCRDYLLKHYDSIEVYMTRTEDVHLSRDKKEDLTMRCELARDNGADCLVSIHLNASEAHKLHGAEIYISRRDNVGPATRELANAIMDELVALGIKKRDVATKKSNDMFDENGVAYDYYAINRHCAAFNLPGIIVEAGFMDNSADQEFLFTEEGLRAIGEADARGIAHYLGADSE